MSNNSCVVVFPTIFSQNKTKLLADNIKSILKTKNQPYTLIKKDDDIITVNANDPVFASSAINLLFGIKQVAIANKVENKFDTVISEIAKIGTRLVLKDEKFYIKVEGNAKGYLPKDLEIAATSAIIEKGKTKDAKPGTENNHDKLLYTYLTKSNAYVCIFSDSGLGGIPYGFQKDVVLCCIFDELSAIACLETIKQGFPVRIIVCYRTDAELTNLAKMINQIISRMLDSKIQLQFYKVQTRSKNYIPYLESSLAVLNKIAKKEKIERICLPISPLVFPARFIEKCTKNANKNNLFAYVPLGGLDDDVFKAAREIGLEKFLSKIDKLAKMKLKESPASQIEKTTKDAIKTEKKITVTIGPNNLHDILDSLL